MCAKFGASTLPRYGDIAKKKMGAEICPLAAGGWRGSPAAAGLSIFNRIPLRPEYRIEYSIVYHSTRRDEFLWPDRPITELGSKCFRDQKFSVPD